MLLALVVLNIVVVEFRVRSKISRIDIGMTEAQIVKAIGEPMHVGEHTHYLRDQFTGKRKFYGYHYPYVWDYPGVFLRARGLSTGRLIPVYNTRGLEVEFGDDGGVCEIGRYQAYRGITDIVKRKE